jgi:hypothetical protein
MTTIKNSFEFPHKSRLVQSYYGAEAADEGIDVGMYDSGEVLFHALFTIQRDAVPKDTKNPSRIVNLQLSVDPSTLEACVGINAPDFQKTLYSTEVPISRDEFQSFFLGDAEPDWRNSSLNGFYGSLKRMFTEGHAFLREQRQEIPQHPSYQGIPLFDELVQRESIPVESLKPGMTVAMRNQYADGRTKVTVLTLHELSDATEKMGIPSYTMQTPLLI